MNFRICNFSSVYQSNFRVCQSKFIGGLYRIFYHSNALLQTWRWNYHRIAEKNQFPIVGDFHGSIVCHYCTGFQNPFFFIENSPKQYIGIYQPFHQNIRLTILHHPNCFNSSRFYFGNVNNVDKRRKNVFFK